jgi:hypothetical protein
MPWWWWWTDIFVLIPTTLDGERSLLVCACNADSDRAGKAVALKDQRALFLEQLAGFLFSRF